jgi:hypothetical protein
MGSRSTALPGVTLESTSSRRGCSIGKQPSSRTASPATIRVVGRPRVSREVRHLIVRMARDNFLWGAPRIHGELLMLGFKLSEATVSRYMPPRSRRLGPSWRTFLRNQAMAFGHCQYAEERSGKDAGVRGHSYAPWFQRSAAAKIATVRVGLRRALGQPRPTLNVRRIRSAQRDRGVTHRATSVSRDSRRTLRNRSGAVLPIRSPPRQAQAPFQLRPRATQDSRSSATSRAEILSRRSL